MANCKKFSCVPLIFFVLFLQSLERGRKDILLFVHPAKFLNNRPFIPDLL